MLGLVNAFPEFSPMQTVVVSQQADGWRVEHGGASDQFSHAAEAYRAGLAQIDRLESDGSRAQLLMVTGLEGGPRAYEAFVRFEG
jgi:hypothetical protein